MARTYLQGLLRVLTLKDIFRQIFLTAHEKFGEETVKEVIGYVFSPAAQRNTNLDRLFVTIPASVEHLDIVRNSKKKNKRVRKTTKTPGTDAALHSSTTDRYSMCPGRQFDYLCVSKGIADPVVVH